MDKILLTAFLTALAGFITAALSIVKLVNEKESKTTEFRQAWTQSARSALAELVSKINSHANAAVASKKINKGLIENLRKLHSTKNDNEKNLLSGIVDHQYEHHHKAVDRSASLSLEVQQAYANARMHFKLNDPEFMKIENKFDIYSAKISDIRKTDEESEWDTLKEQVYAAAFEITVMGRGLLKSEWEKVKLGEPAYQKTKKWSVWFCVVMLFILITIATHAFLAAHSDPGDRAFIMEAPIYGRNK